MTGELRNATKLCITDVGSTTTKVILFQRGEDGTWTYVRREAPTTVERPYEDVSIGVLQAFRALEEATGETLLADGVPAIPYLSTSSAGGGLAMVVTGLIKQLTAETAQRVAMGAGAIVLDTICVNDGRTPYRQIEDLKRLRPDMVLLAGGYDGEAISQPVFLAELLIESEIHPKLNPGSKLPVVYGGNANALPYVERALDDRFLFYPVPNICPNENVEETRPARAAINEIFMDHVMSMAPGYDKLKPWVATPIRPTPAAFAKIIALASERLDGSILAIDIGGATTDVFTACRGEVIRTVSANIGMSYSVLNVARLAGPKAIAELLSVEMSERELLNRIGNKFAQPTSLPTTRKDTVVEWATASAAIREAVREHVRVLRGIPERERPEELEVALLSARRGAPGGKAHIAGYDLIIGSGGILSHSPREAAAQMIIDALAPDDAVKLAVDRAFMFPHLGVLSEVDKELAKKLFFDLALVDLGTIGEHRHRGGWTGAGEQGDAPEGSASVDAASRPAESGDAIHARTELVPEARVRSGRIEAHRELATEGDVLVSVGDTVASDTIVAHATREFLRPFFLPVTRALHREPEELESVLLKGVGDTVSRNEVIARQKMRLGRPPTYRSPVDGVIEKALPDGTLLVRERPEDATVLTTVEVAKELGVHPSKLKPHLKVEVGEEIERGQWLAAALYTGLDKCESPVRGKVARIDLHFGLVMIEPLHEELQIPAWLPGVVDSVSERGCVIASDGTEIVGLWGSGGAVVGTLAPPVARGSGMTDADMSLVAGSIVVVDCADERILDACRDAGVAGLIAGGVDLSDVMDLMLGYTLVVTGEFGSTEIDDDIRAVLAAHAGETALIDGTTQLRVGVQRPRVILPRST